MEDTQEQIVESEPELPQPVDEDDLVVAPVPESAPLEQGMPGKATKKVQRNAEAWGQGQMIELNGLAQEDPSTNTRRRSKHIKPPAKLMRIVTQALVQWDMLQDGDRLLLGLSGGKDSLSLLHILLEFKLSLIHI